jgi:Zn-dependent M16 (insulinase) family peptidase
VLPKLLSWFYLFPNIVIKNGAYGSGLMAEYDEFVFWSYADPNIVETFDIFRNATIFFENFNILAKDFESAKVKALSGYVLPKTNLEKGKMILKNYIIGRTEEDIQKEYQFIRRLKQSDIRLLKDDFKLCVNISHLATFGPREGIDENNDMYNEII